MCLAYSITRHLTNMPIMEAIQSELNYMQTELKQQAGKKNEDARWIKQI